MKERFTDWIDDFAAGEHFLFVDPGLKEDAPRHLLRFAENLDKNLEADWEQADALTLERALAATAQHNPQPEWNTRLPELLELFFQFLSATSRYPLAERWEEYLGQIKPHFLSRLRPDGTLKGETHQKKAAEVGRNDPCPCGSGKKFKKCCMPLIS